MNRGYVLISVLIITALLSFIVSRSFLHASNIQSAIYRELHALKAKSIGEEDILEKALTATSSNPCIKTTASVGKIEIGREVCSAVNFVEKSFLSSHPVFDGTQSQNFPRFDYNLIFENFLGVLSQPAMCNQYALSKNSLCSGRNFQMPTTVNTDLILHENLKTALALSLLGGNSSPKTIATLGFVEFNSEVNAQNKLLLVAGGDISIKSLKNAGSAEITLISGTGKIKIDWFEPSIALTVIAQQGVDLPQAPNIPSKILPALIRSEVRAMLR